MHHPQSALAIQVGGDHYKSRPIQPIQFSMANSLDACASSILKYVTRHASKNGRQDLEKALHYVDLRLETATAIHKIDVWIISPEQYCRENNLSVIETAAVIGLGLWLETGMESYAGETKRMIEELIAYHYPTGE